LRSYDLIFLENDEALSCKHGFIIFGLAQVTGT